MDNTTLNRFMENILSMCNSLSEMGDASVSAVGTVNANNQLVNHLRQTALQFASEYTSKRPDRKKLDSLSKDLEGALRTVAVFYNFSDKKLDELVSDVDALLKLVAA